MAGQVSFRRLADGDACEFCLMLDGAPLKTADPMPIHPGCGCSVEIVDGLSAKAEAPPSTSVGPASIPDELVSGTNVPTATREAVTTAGEQLDEAIKVTSKPSSLVYEELDPGVGGQMDRRTRALSVTTSDTVTSRGITSVYHHEFGHFIDYKKISTREAGYFEAKAARKELVKVLRRTDAVKVLREIAKGLRGSNKAMLTYLLSEDELIARAFQAWMARQDSVAAASARALWGQMAELGPTNERIAKACAFENDDLDVIEEAMQKWLRTKGFL